jgi:hypothetical protein
MFSMGIVVGGEAVEITYRAERDLNANLTHGLHAGGDADDAGACIPPQPIVQFAAPSTSVVDIACCADVFRSLSVMVASPDTVMKQGLLDEADLLALGVAVAFNVPLGRSQVAMGDELLNVAE